MPSSMKVPEGWEPFKKVLQRQKPQFGKPFHMLKAKCGEAFSGGDPWRGAYTTCGQFYRFYEGDEISFRKFADLAFDQCEQYMNKNVLSSKDLLSTTDHSSAVQGTRFVVAKNLRDDVVGGILVISGNSLCLIGTSFVVEDYRHVGIGEHLLQHILQWARQRKETVVFNAQHHLSNSLPRFGLNPQLSRHFVQYSIENPNGFSSLEKCSDDFSISLINEQNLLFVNRYLETVGSKAVPTIACFSHTNKCVGVVGLMEPQVDVVSPIVFGPLYADSETVAEFLLQNILSQFIPEEDMDFNPDPSALHRRKLVFYIPAKNSKMIRILHKLAGTAKIKQHSLKIQTWSNGVLPGALIDNVYAAADLHNYVL